MDPTEAAAADPTAITLSIIALVVSVVALGFAGWQAINAHLARTAPLRASFTLIHPQRVAEPVKIHNSGGSTASEVRITITRPKAREDLRTATVHIPGVVGAGQTVPIPSTLQRNPFMVDLYVPKSDESGTWTKATEPSPEAEHLVAKWAAVEWIDWRGKTKRGRIALW